MSFAASARFANIRVKKEPKSLSAQAALLLRPCDAKYNVGFYNRRSSVETKTFIPWVT